MLGKRIINTATGAGAACTTDTVQILDGVPFQSIATYQLDGNANDLTTNYNGTASNVTYSTGKFGQAGVFNGSSSYIDTTYTVSAVSTQSISVWFKTTSTGGYRTIFSDAPSNGAAVNTRMQIYTTPTSTYDVIIGNNSGYWIGTGNSISSYIDGNWHNLIATYNGTDVKIYIDGSLFQSFTSTIPFGTAGNQSLVIGKAGLNNVNYWNGSLDQVRIYDKALSAADVTTLYNETAATALTNPTFNAPSLVAYYKMNDATDETGSYDGTPTNVNFNVAGKFGNAGEFNGSSSYISVSGQLPSVASDYSISFWANPTTISASGNTIFTNINAGGSLIQGQVGILFFDYNSVKRLRVYIITSTGSTATAVYDSTSAISTGTFSHIVVNIDINGAPTAYVNGSTFAMPFLANTTVSTQGSDAIFGKFQNSSFFNGKLDQIRIFDRAITANEVTTLYNEVECIPTIVPTDNFNTVLYTANGGTLPVTTVGFQPDLVWVKSRVDTQQHLLTDSVRGVGNGLISNLTLSEAGVSSNANGKVQSFDIDGFTVNIGTNNFPANNYTNDTSNGGEYVAWNWKAANTTTTIAAGTVGNTIASDVRANTDAGFSIVSYAGNNATSATISHGLDLAPEMVIIKARNFGAGWPTLGVPGGNFTYCRRLNDTAVDNPSSYYSAFFNSTLPTSSVFSVGNSDEVNDGYNYIAYCFHSVDGMSKIGSYVGTGAAGNSIVTGFRPAFVMFKSSSNPYYWYILDNKRNTSNPINSGLFPNDSLAEITDSNYNVDFNSNGFTLQNNTSGFNQSGATYIFMAFAEEVFDPNGVTRNATDPFGDSSELALYKFEDNANDSTGSYNGTASNITYSTGYIDKAAVFNGSNSGVSLPNFMPSGNASRSVSMWIKTTQTTAATLFKYGGSSTNLLFNFRINDGGAGGGTNTIGIGFFANDFNRPATGLMDGNWHHVAATYDGTNAKIYIDGSQTGADFATGGVNTTATTALIGSDGGSFILNGSIDQVRVFNKALDAGEVTQLYNE